jgi:diketogulonate reductase-like aldo/keto reductase
VKRFLNERAFSILDRLIPIAKELGVSPGRVALAWVQRRPGVTSTIIGARTLAQLDENVAALELQIPPAHLAALDEVSKPALDFPADFIRMAGAFAHGGVSVNGVLPPVLPLAPKTDAERY